MAKEGIVNPAGPQDPPPNHGHGGGGGEGDLESNLLSLASDAPVVVDYGATSTSKAMSGSRRNKLEASAAAEEGKSETFRFDWLFFKRFYQLHSILFFKVFSASSALFFFLLCMVLLKEYIVYQVGLIAGGYYLALGTKDQPAFWRHTFKSLLLILGVSFVNATTEYMSRVLAVTFRKILTGAAHQLYFADIRFYQINVLDRTMDNPDQRMTQDINKFCTTYCEVLPKLLVSPFTIGYYCYQGYQRSGWQGPVGCFGYFLFGTAVNKFLMGPVINFVVKQERREGDFRFLHMLIRVHSEPIAFQQASLVEQGKVNESLHKLAETQHALYLRQYALSFFVNLFDYVGSIFSYMMLAIPIFSGRYDNLSPSELSLLISNNAFILIYLIYTFTSVVDLADKFPDVAGVTHRIAQLFERLHHLEEYWGGRFPPDHDKHLDTSYFEDWSRKRDGIRNRLITKTNPSESSKKLTEEINDNKEGDQKRLLIWSMENVTFSPPTENDDDKPLVKDLNLEVAVGESILISGDSSAGKTSLLRLLRGLWPTSGGHLKRHYPPGPHCVYFCTQKSYLTWGTLREQISFPLLPDTTNRANNIDDKLIYHYLEKLKLTPILERVGGLDVFSSWASYDSLSPGECQRLCLLRVFYHQPVVAILDEVTSALPLDMEDFIYSEMKRLGITMISVGHRQSIRRYHDKQLIIDSKKGGWSIHRVREEGI